MQKAVATEEVHGCYLVLEGGGGQSARADVTGTLQLLVQTGLQGLPQTGNAGRVVM